jgi:hypothetical protein
MDGIKKAWRVGQSGEALLKTSRMAKPLLPRAFLSRFHGYAARIRLVRVDSLSAKTAWSP